MRKIGPNVVLVSLTLLLFSAGDAPAAHWDVFARLCPEEWVRIPELERELGIPVGCEIIDCCPGCPGPPMIDWRILVEKGASSVTLRFEGLSEQQLAGLKTTGNVKMDKGSFTVGPGESSISGFPRGEKGQRAPMAFVVPQIDASKVAGGDQDAGGEAASVQIMQYVGDFVVNTFRSRYGIVPCRRTPSPPEDRIRLTSNTTSDNAVIVADYRTGAGCQNDLIHRTSGTVGIGNALTNAPCNSDVSVFSDDNAMSFEAAVATWTNIAGDTHTVGLQPIINVPVSIWVALAGADVTATNDIANANLLYNQNNVGVQFTPTINDVSGNAAAVTAIGTGCGTAGGLAGTAFHTANTINLYYVNGAFTGVNCNVNRNVSFIGTTANLGSAPHEIGHAYGLRPSGSGGHTNGLAGFGNNNIMNGGGPGTRDHFSVGQAFRLNVSNISMLNTNGNRVGGTRDCPPLTTSNICPELALDSLPH